MTPNWDLTKTLCPQFTKNASPSILIQFQFGSICLKELVQLKSSRISEIVINN